MQDEIKEHYEMVKEISGETWGYYLCAHCGESFHAPQSKLRQKERAHRGTFACRYGGEVRKLEAEGKHCMIDCIKQDRLSRLMIESRVEVVHAHARKRNSQGLEMRGNRYTKASWAPLWAFLVSDVATGSSPSSTQQQASQDAAAKVLLRYFRDHPELQPEIEGAYRLGNFRAVCGYLRNMGLYDVG